MLRTVGEQSARRNPRKFLRAGEELSWAENLFYVQAMWFLGRKNQFCVQARGSFGLKICFTRRRGAFLGGKSVLRAGEELSCAENLFYVQARGFLGLKICFMCNQGARSD